MLEITDAIERAIADLRAAAPDPAFWSGGSAITCEEQIRVMVAELTRWREQLVTIDLTHVVVSL